MYIDFKKLFYRLLRNQILQNEFSANVKILQNFPPMDVHVILSKGAELAKQNKELNIF